MSLIPIRFSHLLGHSGVGAIVRGPHTLMVVHDISDWTDKDGVQGTQPILYVERVKQALGITQELREPPIAKEASGRPDGVCIPATRFPRWMRCPRCGRLYPRSEWKKQQGEYPVCTDPAQGRKCGGTDLEQVPYVLVHPEGYLAEVPWHFLTHKDAKQPEQQQCHVSTKLVFNGETKMLSCEGCHAQRRFNEKEPQSFGRANIQPWLYDSPAPDAHSADSKAIMVKVNDSLAYSPVSRSALVIPPESRMRKGTPVDRLYRNAHDRKLLDGISDEIDRARKDLQRKIALGRYAEIARKYGCSVDDIRSAVDDLESGYPYYGKTFTNTQLFEDEYRAFLEELDYLDDEDFVTHRNTEEWKAAINDAVLSSRLVARTNVFEELVRVDRLKEVRVFEGFKRANGDTVVPPAITGETTWFPAIELYGEGIFFTVNEDALQRWERNEKVARRFDTLFRRFIQANLDEPPLLTPRFVLLHTLSHLIIRQLEVADGYPAASLSERLYCSPPTSELPMAGVLIYTTAPDISGTLGGLAELAEPKRFIGVVAQALDHADWCSSDPVCREHDGHGPGRLNLAACHACALIPDTACAYNNVLLDRLLVKGDSEKGIPSLFTGEG